MTIIRFFQVGGSIRDTIMGKQSKDVDYAVEADSFDAMREEILDRGGKIFLETPKFLTIRAHMPITGACDFVLCRKESAYRDGRHPDVVEVGTIYDDLARRDFTVNAIALDLDTKYYVDPHGGQDDIRRNILRCVGSARERFEEDGLRLLRALRFHITKGFRLDSDIEDVLQSEDTIQLLAGVSGERVREELYKMFAHDTYRTLEVLQKHPWIVTVMCITHRIKLIPSTKDM